MKNETTQARRKPVLLAENLHHKLKEYSSGQGRKLQSLIDEIVRNFLFPASASEQGHGGGGAVSRKRVSVSRRAPKISLRQEKKNSVVKSL